MNEKTALKRPPAPLKAFAGEKPPSPAWFDKALSVPTEHGVSTVQGANIYWKAWGQRGQPGLVLVHGGVAHKDWWDGIAPFLSQTRRIVALDLSGMGDSDHRDTYRMEYFAEEVMTTGREGGAFDGGAPFVVGHSFGGFVTLNAAMMDGEQLRGIAIIDSPVRPPSEQRNSAPPSRGGHTYPSFDEALQRFRLLPEQSCDNAFLLDHIARRSLKEAPRPDGSTGWTWKFDPDLWKKMSYTRKPPTEIAASLKTRMAIFRGAGSVLVNDEIWSYMAEVFGPQTAMISIPDAQHHVILDQPIAMAAALETLTGPSWGG